MFSMKFPHLFLRPEIIITSLWGWEWSGGGGQVRHRSARNSGTFLKLEISQSVSFFFDITCITIWISFSYKKKIV